MRAAIDRNGARAARACVIALVAVAVAIAFVGLARSSSASTTANDAATLVLYTAPLHEMFVNNDDDEERGDINNPFGTREGTAPATGGDDEKKEDEQAKGGPFPGDAALFSFAVYRGKSLSGRAGTAVFTCQYAFGKNAYCDVSVHLGGSMLFGAGAFSFSATRFAIAVTGGSGKYAGATGELRATPNGKHGQRLTFVLD